VLPIILQNGIDTAIQRLKSVQKAWQLEEQTTSTALIFQGLPQDTVFQLAFFVMSVFTIIQIRNGQRPKKDFTIIFTYMCQLQVPLNSLGTSVQEFQKAVVNSERLINTLKEDSETTNTLYAKEMTEGAADIEFDSVAVGSLNSLTFRCETETTTIVLGIPNSERASFTHLLVCVSKAHSGIIKVGGVDIRGYTPESLRRKVGLIPRECYLLGENVMGSLKFGLRDSESIDDNAVFAACKTVNIHDKILKLPGGYYAPLDQNLCGLDREESRRLTLAWLLLQNPGIIICDGAITALHTETDQDLQKALKDGFHRRTVLVFE
jgi:ABC-type multidrug transport system fused ATPase/permease subunit